ncbi:MULTISPECIES: Gfo/Idh/MocA family oxidoreductase [unclassified Streptomyces]|uniref:Gfo/Idh/MocA family protein n=1 Tax=unclassified Streptomyces TaxID=2593676 RepID=UPI000DC3D97A|nr:Gfo/Idh/MocA family oxidoreductase [Streptomyces sp. PsTaAH-137]RAJ86849.1 myo-inositol 2-dehydrogenase [Streptomyces sp. PsTaAH-137]
MPLGVAVIGTGKMGSDHVRRIDTAISGARVVAVADVEVERARKIAADLDGCTAHGDAAAALAAPGVDAVLIASSGPAHEEALTQSLALDLPVLCEKPLTPDAASAYRIVEAERRLGHRRIQVGFMRRFDAEYQQLKAALDGGGLGRPLMLHHRHRNTTTPGHFTERMMITDSAAHEMDVTRWLTGHEIAAVQVVKPAPLPTSMNGVPDPQLVILETTGGVIADVELYRNAGFGDQVRCEAVCEHGTARIGDDHAMVVQTAGRWGGAIPQDYLTRFRAAYDCEVQAWVDAARAGRVVGPSSWDGYAAAAACEAGVTAQATGVRTVVDLADDEPF